MSFRLITRPDRIGTEILSILFQFYYCYINNYYGANSPLKQTVGGNRDSSFDHDHNLKSNFERN